MLFKIKIIGIYYKCYKCILTIIFICKIQLLLDNHIIKKC